MAYAYVKNGGTATGTNGKYSTAKTGSWSTAFTDPSQYYKSINDCWQKASLSEGDIICVSSTHNASGHYEAGPTSPKYFSIICVSNDNVNQLSTGGKEYSSNTNYNQRLEAPYIYGMTFRSDYTTVQGDLQLGDTNGSSCTLYENCIIQINGTEPAVVFPNSSAYYVNCTFEITNPDCYSALLTFPQPSTYCVTLVNFINCTFIAYSHATRTIFYHDTTQNAPNLDYRPAYIFENCDFTQADRPLFLNGADSNYPGKQVADFIRCKEASTNHTRELNEVKPGYQGINFSWCTTGGPFHTIVTSKGRLDSDTTVYKLNGTVLAPNNTPFSYKLVSNSIASYNIPFRVILSEFVHNPGSGSTYTIDIAQNNSASSLTNADAWLEIVYVESGSSKGIFQSSRSTPIIGTGTTLTSSSATWTGLTNPTKQKLSITTTTSARIGIVTIWLNINKPSITLYADPEPTIT